MPPSNSPPSTTLMNDFIGLPIIISDWDALTTSSNKTSPSPSTSTATDENTLSHQRNTSTSSTATTTSTVSSSAVEELKWSTGFSDFADGMWARMTQGMKKKLREAAVEVLKQTDDEDIIGGGQGKEMSWMYDDDARYLD